ncbi:TasA family protein [Thermococcus sp.]
MLVLGLAKAGISYFTDTAVSDGNTISTGDFDIGISKDGSRYYDELKLFSFKDIAPGENRTFTFYVKNRGDYPVSSVGMLFNVTDREDGSLSKAEALVDKTPKVGELSKYLIIKDFRVEYNGTERVLGEYIGKSLRGINMTELRVFSGTLTPGDSIKVTMTFQLLPEAGNDCLTDITEVNLLITASQ